MTAQIRHILTFRMIRALSYAGCGFNGSYYIGITKALSGKGYNLKVKSFCSEKRRSSLVVSSSEIWMVLKSCPLKKLSEEKLNFSDLHFAGASAGAISATNAALWHGDNVKREMELIFKFQKIAK